MTYSLLDRIHGAFWGVVIAQQLTQPHRSITPCLEALTQGVEWVCRLATGNHSGGLAIASEDCPDADWNYRMHTILPLMLYAANDGNAFNHSLNILLTTPSSWLAEDINNWDVGNSDVSTRNASTLDGWSIAQLMASAIAHALQPSPLDLSLIEVLIAIWPIASPSLPHPLIHLHTWLTSPTSLATVTHSLSTMTSLSELERSLVFALYCSLSSVSDARLALLRASRSSYNPPLTTLFTGAFLGTSYGALGFPIVWKRDRHLGDTLDRLAEKLLAIRAGVYMEPGAPSPWSKGIPILAAPGIFHP